MHRRYPDDFGGDKYNIIEWKEDNTWFVLAPDQNFKDAAKRLIDEVLKQ